MKQLISFFFSPLKEGVRWSVCWKGCVICIISIFILASVSFAQKPKIHFLQTSYDFGIIENSESPLAIFEFINTGNAPLTFLPTKSKQEIRVIYPEANIQPSEKGKISVYYMPAKIGIFDENILIYSNAGDKPVTLNIKGNITSIVECPTFDDLQNKNRYIRDIIVIDKITKEPVYLASVKFTQYDTRKIISNRTNKNGKFRKQINIGLYKINIEAQGYIPHQETMYIKKTAPVLIFEIEPVMTEIVDNKLTEEDDLIAEEVIHAEVEIPVEEEIPVEVEIPVEEETPAEVEIPVVEEIQVEEETPVEVEIPVEEETPVEDEIPAEEDLPVKDARPDVEITEIEIDNLPVDAQVSDIKNAPEEIESEEVLPLNQYAFNNIVFLIDKSLSMEKRNKLSLLKTSIKNLIKILRYVDKVSVISYSNKPQVLINSVTADQKDTIISVIDSLTPYGLTYGVRGLNSAYEIAFSNFIQDGNNQIILATDGKFNSPEYSEIELISMIRRNAKKGVAISIIGFGKDEKSIQRLKRMANFGRGNYMHISNIEDAEEILIDEIKVNSRKD